MTIEEFRTEVEEAAELHLGDLPRSYTINFDLDDADFPRAELIISMGDGSTWIIPVTLNEYGEIGIEAGNESFLPLNGESIYATLWLEAVDRLADSRSVT